MKRKAVKLGVLLLVLLFVTALVPLDAMAVTPLVTTREELVAAIAVADEGRTITLGANITGDPININDYQKTFKIDRTSSNYTCSIIGGYSAYAKYYAAYGYGAEGVTMTHAKTTSGEVDTYTYTPIDDSTIAAYVARTDAIATSAAYAATTLDLALEQVSGYYTYVHLKKDFTGTAATKKSTAFTLFADDHAATGTINYSGTSNYDVATKENPDGSIGVSFKLISLSVENAGVTKRYSVAELGDAAAYANACTGDTVFNILGYVTLSAPVELNENVTLSIASGKTLVLYSDLVSNGPMVNGGKITFYHGATLKIPASASLGTVALQENYKQISSSDGSYTTYGTSADDDGDVAMKIGVGEYETYGTLKYALRVAAGNEGETVVIKLLKDITAEKEQSMTDCTLDLNGFTLSTAANSYLNVSNGDMVFKDSSAEKSGKVTGGSSSYGLLRMAYSGNLTLESGTFEDTGGLCAISSYGRNSTLSSNSTVIEIKSGATVKSAAGSGIMIEKAGNNVSYAGVTANIYGKINAGDFAVYINGSVSDSETAVSAINVYDGAELTVSNGVGIYAAGYARWNIYGGTITGDTGIYIKSGVLNVTGGEIIADGAYAEPSYNADGANITGDAVIADSCGYPGGAPVVSISGGALTSANGYALRECMTSGTTPVSRLLISGGSFKGAEGKLISSTLVKFITGGKFSETPAQVADGYMSMDGSDAVYTKLVVRADAAAKIGDVTYATLTAAVNAAPSGGSVELLKDADETVTVGKRLTITRNGFTAAGISAGAGFVLTSDDAAYTVDIAPEIEVVLSESVDAVIGGNVSQEDAAEIATVIDQTQITGVAEAVKPASADGIIESAGVDVGTLGEDDVVEVAIDVAVEVTEADLTNGTVTFNVDVTATVKKNDEEVANGIPVPNSALNGADIEVLLPLPAGFIPQEIIHIHDDSTRDRFLEKTGNPDAKKQFEVVNIAGQSFAKLYVTGFSGLQVNLTPTVIAKIGAAEYGTLQEAVNAAIGGQTIVLQDDCDEAVIVRSKTITIDKNSHSFDAGKITIGSNCTKRISGEQITISYSTPTEIEVSRLYDINIENADGGSVNAGRKTAPERREITLRVTPKSGYELLSVKVTKDAGGDVAITEKDGTYIFIMPGDDVTVTAVFRSPVWTGNPFTDVSQSDAFYDAVRYLYEKGIMNGTEDAMFEPHTGLNRAMMATMLWRAEGKPAAAKANSFNDVPEGTWYTEAVAWAAGVGLVEGYGDGNFGPEDSLTTEQMITLLYRYSVLKGTSAGTPAELESYKDVSEVSSWALDAVKWACGNGIFKADGLLLKPQMNCERVTAAVSLTKLLNK